MPASRTWTDRAIGALFALLLATTAVAVVPGDGYADDHDDPRPVVFVHGHSGSATQFETHAMRFTSNGVPQELVHAFEYDTTDSGPEHRQQVVADLDALIEGLLDAHDAEAVDLVGHSRGTGVSLDYLEDEERAAKVANYVNLDGSNDRTVPHDVRALAVWGEPFMGEGGDDGVLHEADNVYFRDQSHTEVATSAETFAEMYEWFTGQSPATTDVVPQDGPVTIAGRASIFPENTGAGGATVDLYETDDATGQRVDDTPVESATLPADGSWGPWEVDPEASYEFALARGDTDVVHHFYAEPFERDNHLVRLLTSDPGEGVALLIDDGPDHVALVTSRDMEWWGDQGEDSDALEIDGTDIVNEGTSPRSDRNIGVFAFDEDADGESNPTEKMPRFTIPQTTFLTGADLHIPASEEADGTVEVAATMRGGHTATVNVPDWPSDEHRVSIAFRDYVPTSVPELWDPPADPHAERPVVFVHGGSGSAAQFETHAMRFTSNGFPQDHLVAFEYDTSVSHSDIEEQVNADLEATIAEVLDATGADRVNLVGHSRGTSVSHSYLNSDPDRAAEVANYVNLDGGGGPDAPGGVRTLAVWGEGGEDREIAGADNVRFLDQAHTEVATSAETFAEMYEFYLGEAPGTTDVIPRDEATIAGRATIFPQNAGVEGARVELFEVDPDTGHRLVADPVAATTLSADGSWGPWEVDPGASYAFVLTRDDSDIVHHFHAQPFERDNHFVRLQTSNPGEGAALLIDDGPDHVALVLTRNREWWGDQGEDSDALEIDGVDVINEGTSPRSDRNIGVFVFDEDADGESSPNEKMPRFTIPQTTFLTGVDLHVPASEEAAGSVEIATSPRGGERTEVVNVPDWPSDEHRVSVQFRDYRSIADEADPEPDPPTDPDPDPDPPTDPDPDPPAFVDVEGVHADNVRTLQLRGIVQGLDEERFGPTLPLRRDQMASIVARVLELEPVDSGPFTDVGGSVHAGAINALAAEGIVLGTAEDRFAPRREISRDQVSSVIARALELEPVSSGPFSDVAGSVHAGAINALAAEDVVHGYGDGTFRPRRSVQRAQAASMVARALPLFDARG